jgi:chemotaxis protein MotB
MTELIDSLPKPIETARSAGSAWMLIFADTLSLLVAFFVLLFSMSTLRVDTWLSMANGLAQRLNPARYQSETMGPSDQNLPRTSEQSAMNLGYLGPLIEDKIRSIPGFVGVTVTPLPDRIVISIPTERLFQASAAKLTANGANSIFLLGGFLGTIGNKVMVAGYGESAERSAGGPMVLSIERAASVARSLAASGYGRVTSAMGYADPQGQGFTIDPTAEDRNRIDVVVLDATDGAPKAGS